jgi:hypothetical protein
MSATFRQSLFWTVLVVLVAVVLGVLLLPTGPVIRDTPFIRDFDRIHQICSTLRFYADEHTNSPAAHMSAKSVDELATAGILSVDDVTFIRGHHVEFCGFDPSHIGGDVPVLVATNVETFRRIVGYSDGSARYYELKAP